MNSLAGSADGERIEHDDGASWVHGLAVYMESSFNLFYEANRSRALRLAIALCGDPSKAEEVMQDAFVSAFSAWRRISSYDRPDAWLMRVVANRSISARRKARNESRLIDRLAKSAGVWPSW